MPRVSHHPAKKSARLIAWLRTAGTNAVGDTIRAQRLQRKMTQRQLVQQCQSRGLNLSRGTLAKIEARLRLITGCELFIIARVLDARMDDLFPVGYGEPLPR